MESHKSVNQKLESFMKRNLPSSDYQRIRCYERCVVDKSMRLALVTSKNLIITDSPPRTILYTLPLVDFISVNLVQDLPDFLHGDIQLKSQHISLKFRQDSLVKLECPLDDSTNSFLSASSDGDKSPRSTKSIRSLAASLSSLSSPSWHESLNGSQRRSSKLKKKFDQSPDSTEAHKRLNLSDSGSSVSSWSQDSNHDSPVFSTELDLFLLTDSTLFFKLLQAASLNEKIAETKSLTLMVHGDPKIPKKRKKSIFSTVQCQLFTQLSSDIHATDRLERRFELVQELQTAAAGNPAIKRYFWKDQGLCRELVSDMGRYRRLRSHSPNNRADEMEYLILLESCVVSMFRESEHLPHRVTSLAANSYELLRQLIENLSLLPHIPNHLTANAEMEGLVNELLDTTISLLFEIVLAASEHPTFGTDLTLSHVVKIVENNAANFVTLYSKVIDRGLGVISRTVSVSSTFLVFMLFYVVEALSRSSGVCGGVIKSDHLEDIRYYCKNPELRITRYSPLQSLAIQKVNDLLENIS